MRGAADGAAALPAARPIAAMRLRVSDTTFVPELVAYLESDLDGVAQRVGDDEVEVSLLGSYCEDTLRMELYLRIRAWEAGRRDRGVVVDVLE